MGQVYDHESGHDWEVVRLVDGTVTFHTSDGDLVRVDEDDALADIASGTLVPQDDEDEEE